MRWESGKPLKLTWQVFVTLISVITVTSGLEAREVLSGEDAVVIFKLELSGSPVAYDLLSSNGDRPFYSDGMLDPAALQPNQRDRFAMRSDQNGDSINATLFIKRDSGNQMAVSTHFWWELIRMETYPFTTFLWKLTFFLFVRELHYRTV